MNEVINKTIIVKFHFKNVDHFGLDTARLETDWSRWGVGPSARFINPREVLIFFYLI